MPTSPSDSQCDLDSAMTSLSLLSHMRQRDQDAWDRFVKVYCPTIYAHCRRAGVEASEAADVCQNVLLTVAKKLELFRKESPADSFRGWIYRITANKIVDHFRRRSKEFSARGGSDFARFLDGIPDVLDSNDDLSSHLAHGIPSIAESGEQQRNNSESSGPVSPALAQSTGEASAKEVGMPAVNRDELRMALADLQATFEPSTWRAFEGTAVEKRTAKEVGAELGMSAQAVRQARYRVLKKFRDTYGELIDFD